MDMIGTCSFFSKVESSLPTASERSLAFIAWIIPGSIGWVLDVMFGWRKINSIHSTFSTCGLAV